MVERVRSMAEEEKKSHHIFAQATKGESWAEFTMIKLFQRTAMIMTPTLAKTNITPNQVTFFRFLVLIPLSTFLFALGDHVSILAGLFVFGGFHYLDGLEGSLARFKSMQTALGGWLDWAFDMMGNNLITIGMTIGALNSIGRSPSLGLPTISLPAIIIILSGFFALFSQQITLYLNNELERKFSFASNSRKIVDGLKGARLSRFNHVLTSILIPDNWVGQILFSVGWPFLIGALLNQLALTLFLIALLQSVRVVALFTVMVRALQTGESRLPLVRLMKELSGAS